MSAYNRTGTDPVVIRELYRRLRKQILTTGIAHTLLTYRRVAFQNETQRVCLDSNIQYYHVGANVYSYDS